MDRERAGVRGGGVGGNMRDPDKRRGYGVGEKTDLIWCCCY